MAKQKYAFSQAERHAVYMTHGERCYICRAALTMSTMQVDHVVPESIGADPALFAEAREALGLPADFDVNTFENWLPSCAPCNLTKGAMKWTSSLLVQQALQRASDRAPRARKAASDLVTERKLSNAFATILAADEVGYLTPEIVERLAPLMRYQLNQRSDDLHNHPLQLTPFIDMLPFTFDTVSNFKPVLGTGEMVNMGNKFAISGPGFSVMVEYQFLHGERDRYLSTDVYKMAPGSGTDEPVGSGANSPVVRISPNAAAVVRTIGGLRVTLEPFIQEVEEIWLFLSTS